MVSFAFLIFFFLKAFHPSTSESEPM